MIVHRRGPLKAAFFAIALGCAAFSCSGAQKPLPAPEYREPELPEWEPEPQEELEFGLESALDSGEWVEDSAPAMGGAAPVSPDDVPQEEE